MKIRFVCEGKVSRSQVTEKFYNTTTGTNDTRSVGINATLLPHASKRGEVVMQEIGMALEGRYDKQLLPKMAEWADRADRAVLFFVEQTPSLRGDDIVENWDGQSLGFGKKSNTTELDCRAIMAVRERVQELVGRERL